MPDRIQETLSALRVDADRTGLPGSGAVRRRGDRRARNQALGSALTLVAVVAVVVGVSGSLTGDTDRADAPPADPTVSTTQEQLLALAADPFLRESDVTSFGVYENFLRSPDDALEQPRLLQCISSPAGWGANGTKAQLFHHDLEGGILEHVLVFDGSSTAAAALTRVGAEFTSCPTGDPAEVEVTDRGPEPVAGGSPLGFRASRADVPKVATETGYYELGVGRRGNVVVVLEWRAYGNPAEGADGWVWTAERLQTALDRAVR